MNQEELARRLAKVRGVMFDIDGCLILSDGPSGMGGRVLPGAREAIELVRNSGRSLAVFTNGSGQTPRQIAESLRELGLDIRDHEVLTPAVVAAETMQSLYQRLPLLIFGGLGLHHDFEQRGLNVVDLDRALAGEPVNAAAVVIGWDTEFGRDKLQVAAEAVLAGAAIYCTSDAPSFASAHHLNVGVSGFIATGLSHVTGRSYRVLGKPSPEAMQTLAQRLGVSPEEVLVIGDDLILECSMARASGALSFLVTTGTNSLADADAAPAEHKPDVVVDSMSEFVEVLSSVFETTAPRGA